MAIKNSKVYRPWDFFINGSVWNYPILSPADEADMLSRLMEDYIYDNSPFVTYKEANSLWKRKAMRHASQAIARQKRFWLAREDWRRRRI